MDTRQITAILQTNFMTKDIFRGVYPMDQLPSTCTGAMVINTDDHNEPGQHWVAIYYDDVKEYFDSYGIPPQDTRLQKFIGDDAYYNFIQLQRPLSNACGFYCVYYILQRARGKSADDVITLLKNSDSDFIVKDYIFEHYRHLF